MRKHFGMDNLFLSVMLYIQLCTACSIRSASYQDHAALLHSYLAKSHLDINPRCYEHLKKYAVDLKNKKMWALQMFDASSSIPGGIFSRKNTDLGNFDQCMEIEHRMGYEIISGKYCTGKFQPKTRDIRHRVAETNTSIFNTLALCLPTSCVEEEVEKCWSYQTTSYFISEVTCQTKSTFYNFSIGYLITRMLLISYSYLVTFSTFYDIVKDYQGNNQNRGVLAALSVLRNGRNLFATSKDPEKIGCLDGIRVLALMWIIIGHRFYFYYFLPIKNVDYFVHWYNYSSSILFTHSFALNVDTFFVMGGAVATYSFLKSTEREFNFSIVSYYTKRFLRLTPPLAVVVLIHVHMFRFLGSGPLWPVMGETMNGDCSSYWWSALLYLQNYINPLNTCVIATWYLSVDMQMYLLSPFILLSLRKWTLGTLIYLVIASTILIALRFNYCWSHNIVSIFDVNQSLSLTSSTEVDNSFAYSYAPTHMRAPTWLLGVILGYFLYQQRRLQKPTILNKVTVSLVLIVSIATLVFCTFAGNFLLNGNYDRLHHALHQSLIGPMWALAVSGIIFVCANGCGGAINWFLSLPVFEFLAKLSYCMFITHFSVLQYRVGEIREAVTFYLMDVIDECFFDYILTILVALVWYLMFEAPVGALQNLFSKRTTHEKAQSLIKGQQEGSKKNK